jgi:hypothetical protein
MSARASQRRLWWLLPLATTGVLSIVASSTFEEDDDVQARATVDWVLSSLAAPIVRDRGDRTVTITNLRLAGSYEDDAGDELTLDRDRTPIDATSGFDLELVADDPDDDAALSGSLQMDVLARINFGLDEDPTTGQFSIIADGTTTLVTAQTDPNEALIEVGGASGRRMSWGDFREAADDGDEDDDVRLASEAFNTITDVIELGLLGEVVIDATEDNRDELEGMGLDEPLELGCDNLAADDPGESVLLWRADAPGSGEGEIGNGDSLEARYENCRSTLNLRVSRYAEGTIVIDDYLPARGDPPRTLGAQFDFGTLTISETQITITTVPDPASPRVDGGLELLYEETVQPTTP